ncbi:hypothetical protein B0H16DRAFT_524188 [Mycena metata]|uniref:RED-like N-terminal domain-containing protein n=1 Tax=Mycena metata TaxID=1033252 RepID=A0AAD7H8F8_9AGAR|nr:hypothetical protein B0H16DRAFT_524188 [Mycena metata]
MDQDSFRRLLDSGSGSGSGGSTNKQSQRSRGSLLVPGGSNAASARKTLDASEPAFKPRKVKKAEGKYRDRAAERRVGEGNDYAQVEAVLEDFEKRLGDNAGATDAQRAYLGGDSEHSILVKGLDIALLEQNKAKASLSTVDDDSLEQAFIAAAAPAKKRTREDMIRELKEKRGVKSAAAAVPAEKAQEDARALEAAKKQGKFKPIGFTPIGGAATEKKKKRVKADGGVDGERKKKKRKIDAPAEEKSDQVDVSMPPPAAPSTSKDSASASSSKPPPPEDDDMPDDFDIFAGAEEYAGIDLGEDEDDEEGEVEEGAAARKPETTRSELEEGEHAPRKWFEEDESDPPPAAPKLPLPPGPGKNLSRPMAEDDGDEEEEQAPMRLVPLASSALPSIKELLAADKAANSSDKWRKRKDKKGGRADGDRDDVDGDEGAKDGGEGGAKGKGKEKQKQKMSAELKAERDYKRLKNYTDKKAAA